MEMQKLKEASRKLIYDILVVKQGESVAITCDTLNDTSMVDEVAACVHEAGGFPIVIKIHPPRGFGTAADVDLPIKVLSDALTSADVWIELNQKALLYSSPCSLAMARNPGLRYIVLAEFNPDVMIRTIGAVDAGALKPLMLQLTELITNSQRMKITTKAGTDVSCEVESRHVIGCDCGDASKPGFYTLTGDINIVPRFGSVNGRIIVDGTLTERGILNDEQVELTVSDGIIQRICGGPAADWFKAHLTAYGDPNMFKIAHVTIGLNPGAVFSGSTAEDERVWGVTTWGIGKVVPEDAPPNGQDAVSHCDGTCRASTIWLDDRKIMGDGVIVDEELRKLDPTQK